jgi:hypothetical protein
MAADRTIFYLVAGGALLWYLMRDEEASAATLTASARPEPRVVPSFDLAKAGTDLVTFPDIDRTVDLTPLFCSPFDEYGGWGDDRKLAEASRLYLERWAFSPTAEFEAAVRQRDPCVRRHVDALINAFPPFPGQSFEASELAKKKGRQDEARAAKDAADKQARSECEARAVGASTFVVAGAAAITAGIVTGGAAVVPAAGAGAAAGGALGRWISGMWC